MQLLLALVVIPTSVLFVMAIVLFLLLLWLGYARAPRIFGFGSHIVKTTETVEYASGDEETGQPQKRSITTETQSARTVWEWLTVLTISAVITVVALIFTARQAQQQRETQFQQASDDAVQAYYDEMSTLLIEEDLRTSPENSEARTLARSRTLTILSRLDPERRSRVLQFLLEAELVQRLEQKNSIITLSGADLSGVFVPADTDLSYADLSGADLSGADLSATNLSNAYLIDADLSKADLRGATLSRTDLGLADLSGANLSNTDLTYALFNDADLNDATVTGADLWKADMSDAAGVTKDTLVKDAGYVGYTIMPRGKKYLPPPDEVPSEIIKEYPEGRLPSGFWGESLRGGEYETDEFATGFHFELREGWVGNWPEATGAITLCGEEESYVSFCSKQLNFYSPLHVFDKSNPSDRVETDAPTNGYEWMSWLQKHPDLVTSNSGSVTIGGVPGRKIDVTTTSKKRILLFPIDQSEFYSQAGSKDRLLIVDVADETVLINIYSPADQFDKWRPKAMETIDTMMWQGV